MYIILLGEFLVFCISILIPKLTLRFFFPLRNKSVNIAFRIRDRKERNGLPYIHELRWSSSAFFLFCLSWNMAFSHLLEGRLIVKIIFGVILLWAWKLITCYIVKLSLTCSPYSFPKWKLKISMCHKSEETRPIFWVVCLFLLIHWYLFNICRSKYFKLNLKSMDCTLDETKWTRTVIHIKLLPKNCTSLFVKAVEFIVIP